MNSETKLIEMRLPTSEETDEGAEIVFIREATNGNLYFVYGRTCYGSWEQWGGTFTSVLGDNVGDIEHWRKHKREIEQELKENK